MKRPVKVFIIPGNLAPAGPPGPAEETEVEAPNLDGLRVEARRLLEADGLKVRAVSFASDGLVAYAEEVR